MVEESRPQPEQPEEAQTQEAPCAAADDAAAVAVEHAPLAAEQVVQGRVTTGVSELSGTGNLSVGVWEHSAGVSTDTEQDEVFVVISGRGRVLVEGGEVLQLAPGVVGRLLAGQRTRWEVQEPLRKVWVMAKM